MNSRWVRHSFDVHSLSSAVTEPTLNTARAKITQTQLQAATPAIKNGHCKYNLPSRAVSTTCQPRDQPRQVEDIVAVEKEKTLCTTTRSAEPALQPEKTSLLFVHGLVTK